MKNKKGNILTENIVFILLTLIFISMLFTFITNMSSSTHLIEEATAKELALVISSARPGTEIQMNIDWLLDKKQEAVEDTEVIKIEDNDVIVKLGYNSEYRYGFFSDVNVDSSIQKQTGGTYLLLDIN